MFELPELGRRVDLPAGDRLELPARTVHAAIVGPSGVSCLEAHLPAGVLPSQPRHVRDWGAANERDDGAETAGPGTA
jgi:hypothetical protein